MCVQKPDYKAEQEQFKGIQEQQKFSKSVAKVSGQDNSFNIEKRVCANC